ncbi:hypothetical protein BDW69DRAFT_188514 [Aspergillus filifer]
MPLTTYHTSSTKGLSSITTLVVGTSEAILINRPSSNQTANHFFAANSIFEAFPDAKFYAAPYVLAGINREYDEKVKHWPAVFGVRILSLL